MNYKIPRTVNSIKSPLDKEATFITGPLGVQLRVENGRVTLYSLIKAAETVLQMQSENITHNGAAYRMACSLTVTLLKRVNQFH